MTTLDTLARSAVAAIDDSVADLPVPVAPGGALAPLVAWGTVKYALAGAAAAVAVLVALIVAAPNEDVTDTPVTTTVTPSTEVPTTSMADVATTTVADPVPAPDPAGVPIVPAGDDGVTAPVVDTTPPALTVTSPEDGAHVGTPLLEFRGTTEPGATVLASGKFAATVESDGSWTVTLVLAPGANGVVFDATDDAGNTSRVRLTVHLDAPADVPKDDPAPKETTTTTVATSWGFTAWQTYGSCSEPLPYDVFGGTAKPGGTVTVTSPYGSGSTTADAEGAWSLRVEFPGAPYGKTFEVKVRDEYGNVKVFPFVSLYEG